MRHELEKLGLSSKSVSIYLSLLQKGESSVDELSKSTGIKRTGIYPYINELKSHDLISWDEHQVNKALKITNPERISKLAKDNLTSARKLSESIDRLLPGLKAMHQVSGPEYYLEKYVGVDKCKEALEMIYMQDMLPGGYCGEFVYDELGYEWYENHLRKMYKDHKITDHVVFSKDAVEDMNYKELKKTSWYDERYCKYRVHPSLELPKGLDVYIFEDRVLTMYSDDEPTCVVTKSLKYRDYEYSLFKVLWESSRDIEEL